MKLSEVLDVIKNYEIKTNKLARQLGGYLVSFAKIDGETISRDYFPDFKFREESFKTEKEAWHLAEEFANATDETVVNVYVVYAYDLKPVKDYQEKIFKLYSKATNEEKTNVKIAEVSLS